MKNIQKDFLPILGGHGDRGEIRVLAPWLSVKTSPKVRRLKDDELIEGTYDRSLPIIVWDPNDGRLTTTLQIEHFEKKNDSIHLFDRYKLYDFPYEAAQLDLHIDVATLSIPYLQRDFQNLSCFLCHIVLESPWNHREKQYRYLYIVKPGVQGVDMGTYLRSGRLGYYYPLKDIDVARRFERSGAFANSGAQRLMASREYGQLPAYSLKGTIQINSLLDVVTGFR